MRIEHYTELYLDDAMRLCKYIAKGQGSISIVMADPSEFPDPPKGLPFREDKNFAVRVTNDDGEPIAECLYLTRREPDEDIKHRNRWLYSLKLGEAIRRAREAANMTQAELAEKMGYRAYSIDAMERGRFIMDTKLLCKIADAMDCEIELVKRS